MPQPRFHRALPRLFAAGILIALLPLAGCQTGNPLPVAFYNNTPGQLPPITMYVNEPSTELAAQCDSRRCQPNGQVMVAVFSQLQRSEVFRLVNNGKHGNEDYGVNVALRQTWTGDQVTETAQVMAAAATLFIIPATSKQEYLSEITVTWRGVKLGEYRYATPMDSSVSLFDEPNAQQKIPGYVAQNIVSRFISDVQGDDIFSSDRLYAELKADDYRNALRVPTHVGGFRHTDKHIYPDPFVGAQLRFEAPAGAAGVYDVFVYPIRRADWSDNDATLREEMIVVAKDVELAQKNGMYQRAEFEAPQAFQAVHGTHQRNGLHMRGQLQTNDGELLSSEVYLFIEKDKFVKFRLSTPATATLEPAQREAFVAELMASLQVPDESLFTANLRQRVRQNTLQ